MTTTREISLGAIRLGGGNPLFLIAGPCVIESEAHARKIAEQVARIAADTGVPYIYKASYDKANRSSVKSFRGPGLAEGLRILRKIKDDLKVPILSDIHETAQAAPAAEVCDILQIPAFLSRQTDLLEAAGKTGRIVNVKKAQFLSPWEMANVAEKIAATGNTKIVLTERGVSFGYQNLVVDMRSFPILQKLGYPVVFDVTQATETRAAGSRNLSSRWRAREWQREWMEFFWRRTRILWRRFRMGPTHCHFHNSLPCSND
jgi:2-dehydro-3-deoxyphosphooctonate aldolase (KDO 8-P synthase)